MKKKILLLALLVLAGISVNAQEKKTERESNFFMAISAGPSFPAGDFGSKDPNNSQAGFANTGYNINLHLGYQVDKNFGIAAAIPYSKYTLDIANMGMSNVSVDHWQYYGLLVGPMSTFPMGQKGSVDLKVLGGITNANSPVFSYQGTTVMKEDWSIAFAMQLGVNLRYSFNKNTFFFANLDYSAMNPKFESTDAEGNSISANQRIEAVNLGIGIGVKF